MREILSGLRKAVEDYKMIEEGDKIAVALSGGKDSIALLLALKNLQIFYPKHFEIMAVTIDPGSNTFDIPLLEKLCAENDIEYVVDEILVEIVAVDESGSRAKFVIVYHNLSIITNLSMQFNRCIRLDPGHYFSIIYKFFRQITHVKIDVHKFTITRTEYPLPILIACDTSITVKFLCDYISSCVATNLAFILLCQHR